jgi:threonine synthase
MDQVLYNSTRGGETGVTASKAILKGLASDGGLFVPDHIPALDKPVSALAGKKYQEIAYEVMKLFFTDFTEEELKACINAAYDEKFDAEEIVPLTKAGNDYYIELYHGATIAFKDMALSILPHLMTTSAKKNNIKDKIVILTATSGDTGKAALAGFADVPGTGIIVFFPKDGVSYIQKRQMVTQKGANTAVVGIDGNFDDAQRGVKEMFGNKELEAKLSAAGIRFSSANSINIGRLIPQIAYYVYTYTKLLAEGEIAEGEKMDVCVPTGNFGNILAAYYAKCMGLPIENLICASNDNKVLYDFFKTGKYDRNREFMLTISPSMDILISSNLERLIYKMAGEDAAKTAELMNALKDGGVYTVTPDMKAKISEFVGLFATEEETKAAIKDLYEKTNYVIDTHTGVAAAAVAKYKKEHGADRKIMIASTASPYKFARSVMTAIDPAYDALDEWTLIDKLSEITDTELPPAIKDIKDAEVLHKTECATADMQKTVEDIISKQF